MKVFFQFRRSLYLPTLPTKMVSKEHLQLSLFVFEDQAATKTILPKPFYRGIG